MRTATSLIQVDLNGDGVWNPLNQEPKNPVAYTPHPTKPHALAFSSDGRTYSYDENGNMLNDGTRNMTWNYDNRSVSISLSGGAETTFVYDGVGNRVKKTGPAGTIVYIGKLYELSGGVPVKYIFANGQRVVLKTQANTYYYHQDHLGSTGVVTDQDGSKVEDIFYKPFGESASDVGSISLNHKYTGQELDEETGLYFYNARYYNPHLGRFVSADTFVPSPSNPQSFSRYSYVLNNPLRYTDPSGNYEEEFEQNGESSSGADGGGSITIEGNLGDFAHDFEKSVLRPVGHFFKSLFGRGEHEEEFRPPVNVGSPMATPGAQALQLYRNYKLDKIRKDLVGGSDFGILGGFLGLYQVRLLDAVNSLTPQTEEEWMMGVIGSVGEIERVLPSASNYRKIFLKARPDLPVGWHVHHGIPQKYEKMMEALDVNIHEIQFLRGVHPEIHAKVTKDWGRFKKRMGGNPTPGEVAEFFKEMDKKYEGHFIWPGF